MPRKLIELGLIARSHPPANRWAERVLRPYAVMMGGAELAPLTLMHEDAGIRTVWMGRAGLNLHSGDSSNYLDNLRSGRPRIWVAMDGDAVQMLTADPYEGESLASDPGRMVEAVPMPEDLANELAAFAQTYHVEEVFVKRRKDRQPDGSETRAPRILPPEQNWIRK
ncbi:MAG: DUF3305 domain-containing protein [Paracoccus sp. (in: a-proteobacteria)]|nr:DUF3305 domain-containing protein [Paracoccus sp. (in: a-proteobacteria)]